MDKVYNNHIKAINISTSSNIYHCEVVKTLLDYFEI